MTVLKFKQTQKKAQPEPGFGGTEGKAVSISLFATNRFWVVNIFTLMWNSFLQAADSCMQKRSLGCSLRAVSVWSDRWLPAAAWRLLWSRSVSLSVEVVLRYVRRTTDSEAFFHLPCHTPIEESRTEKNRKAGCFLKACVRSQRSNTYDFSTVI